MVDGAPGGRDLVSRTSVLWPIVPVDEAIAHLYRELAGSSDRFGSLHGPSQRAGPDRHRSRWRECRGQGFSLATTGSIEVRVRETAQPPAGIEGGLPMPAEEEGRQQ